MNFGDALHVLRMGGRITRDDWDFSGEWLFLVPGSTFTVQADRPMGQANPDLVGREVRYRPHIDKRMADGSVAPWAPSTSDLLAEDWFAVTQ